MEELFLKVWKTCDTKTLARLFEEYMKSINVKKNDGRRKNNNNTYLIDAKSTGWNRVQCFYDKESTRYGDEDLLLVLRKEAGNYFIIQRKGKRAFECDYRGIITYNHELSNEIIEDHKPLFDRLFDLAN